jgi:hypothetical protein
MITKAYVFMIIYHAVTSCKPVNAPAPTNDQANPTPDQSRAVDTAFLALQKGANQAPSGRAIDLYAIRASFRNDISPPEIDQLPCQYFKQGNPFPIPPVKGGPPLALPGPLQNYYAGQWNGSKEFRFKVSAYNRIYRDPGIPSWLLTPPTTRVNEYVTKLYDVTILNPTQQTCTISAKVLN